MAVIAGILVGGAGRRLGGVAKGLLAAPDGTGTLVARTQRIVEGALPDVECVLVGSRDAYSHLELRTLADHPSGIGPLGGLRALLLEGARTHRTVLAIACDLPFVTEGLVRRLAAAAPEAAAVAPHMGGHWLPVFARYEPERCLEAADAVMASKRRALRAVLETLGDAALALPLQPGDAEALRDWDTPDDVKAGRGP